MDIIDIDKLKKQFYEITEFPEVIKTFQEKDGKRVTIKHRVWGPNFYHIMDSTGRRADRESFKRYMTEERARIADDIIGMIVDYLEAKRQKTFVTKALGISWIMDNPDEKMKVARKVLYFLDTYSIMPRMFLSPFETHEGAEIGVKKIAQAEVFKEEEEDDANSEIPL